MKLSNQSNSDRYKQDEFGQWRYYDRRRWYCVSEQICKQCGETFVSHHKQKFCSRTCRSISQKGVLKVERVERKCIWCGKLFMPKCPSIPTKCCSYQCRIDLRKTTCGRKGPANPRWKGGIRSLGKTGYIQQWVIGRGRLLQHRLVMEKMIGRPLLQYEQVHHKNGIRSDNRPENLELWIKRQPGGQQVEDLLEYARWVIDTYGFLEKHHLKEVINY